MITLKVGQARSLRGVLPIPGDKSCSHRALILSALAEGRSQIRGWLEAEDTRRTLEALRHLGVTIAEGAEGTLTVEGHGLGGLQEPADVLDAGNSGTTLRLLAGLLAGQPFCTVLTGDASLRCRPMARVVEPLRQMGAAILGRQGGDLAPLTIQGGGLRAITHASPVASAQVNSAVLLAGLQAAGRTTVIEPVRSRDHTERMLAGFGAKVGVEQTRVWVEGPARLTPMELTVPGDFSAAAFFLVAALVVEGSALTLQNVGINPTRTGLLEILEAMGARVKVRPRPAQGGEPVADLEVEAARLRGITVSGDLVVRAIDEIPVLCVAAALAEGETVIRDARELRVKESDRLATMAAELGRLGARVEELDEGLRIHGGRLRGAVCQSHGDHRVAMALAVAGLAAEGETVIEDAACIATSFPTFPALLAEVAGPGPAARRHGGP
ncbi:MAG: 3-phosphoshikimate 1-carboxyvinyltransferase [Deltaproteobacteria bacterium]|nr:3-phosphoshikimate 1-carboxyvinyltransferase [Deltaproteobacteria bacterium]